MNYSSFVTQKAALFSAAFFISISAFSAPSPFESIRTKASELLALKQKDRAIELIINFSKTERSKTVKSEISELLFAVGQSFLSKESQEEYENSLNEILSNERSALKATEKCLKLDPQNLDCLIQKARIYYRQRNEKNYLTALEEAKALVTKSTYETLFQFFIERTSPDFKNKQIINLLPSQPNERTMLYLVLELDRAIEARNYSRVKEIINYAEKFYQDWPDIAYFKYKLSLESAESTQKPEDDLLSIYQNKCKSLSHSSARKYRYDFDLCNRGKKT